MRILFITSNRLGDAVLSTGLLSYLVGQYPDARVTIACGPLPAPLFRALPQLDRLIALPKRSYARHWLTLWRQTIGTHWDLVVDLRNSLIGRLVLANRRAFHTPMPCPMHKVAELGQVLGLSPPPSPRIWLDAEAIANADQLLPGHPVDSTTPLLVIGPTANWLGKEWPAARFAELARRLTDPGGILAGAKVAVLAAGAERERAAPVLAALGDRAVDLTGRTDPLTAAACLSRASLYVGNDSGLMHIAAATGVPTAGLFGPGYPDIYGPWGKRTVAITGTDERDILLARIATNPDARDLMDGISVDQVASKVEGLLGL